MKSIVALTTDDLVIGDGGTYLRLGPEPLQLLPTLDLLVTSLPIAKPFDAASTWPTNSGRSRANGPATTGTRCR